MVMEYLKESARSFLTQCYYELEKEESLAVRLEEVEQEIQETGTYTQTAEEMSYGSKMAWRNSNRCIGRLFWSMLDVFDAIGLDTEEQVFQALCQHIEYATNDGQIRPTITIFPQRKMAETGSEFGIISLFVMLDMKRMVV